jgi:hypothetical protein
MQISFHQNTRGKVTKNCNCRVIWGFGYFWLNVGAGIAQSVWRLATGWKVRNRIPVCGRDFPHSSRPTLRLNQHPIQWVLGPFPGVKRPGCGVDHPPPSSTEVKERVELYLYSTSRPSWPILWWTLPLLCVFAFMYFITQNFCYKVHYVTANTKQ